MYEECFQNYKALKIRVLSLEESLREKETMNEKLKYDVANLICFNNTNQRRIEYLIFHSLR